jgi:hypothetical protein
MAGTGRAKNTQPVANKNKKTLLGFRAKDVVTRVEISGAGRQI